MEFKIESPTRNSIKATRNAITRIKNGSPKMKDVIRERCRERIIQERNQILDKARNLESAKKTAKSLILNTWMKELRNFNEMESFDLNKELEFEEEFESEILEDYDDWFDEEIENLLVEGETPVVCPACCKGLFIQNRGNNTVECGECRIPFEFNKSLTALRAEINRVLACHNNECHFPPSCTVIPNSNEHRSNLSCLCSQCAFMVIIL